VQLAAGALVPAGPLAAQATTGIGFDLAVRTPPVWRAFALRTDLTFDHWNGTGTTTSFDQQGQALSLVREGAGGVYSFAGLGLFLGQEKVRLPSGSISRTRAHQTLGVQGGVGVRRESWWGGPFVEVGIVRVFGAAPTAFTWIPVRGGITAPSILASILGG